MAIIDRMGWIDDPRLCSTECGRSYDTESLPVRDIHRHEGPSGRSQRESYGNVEPAPDGLAILTSRLERDGTDSSQGGFIE